MWNQLDYRPLEGFVYAVTPFNFTAIGGNLSTRAGADGQHRAVEAGGDARCCRDWYIFRVLEEAGLPPGVINFVPGDAARDLATWRSASRDLAGVHFTGSTAVFNSHVEDDRRAHVGDYRSYPRIVGETGGKDFIVAHPSADPEALAVAIARGGFEYQGQKCSAASRVYVPRSLWREVRDRTVGMIESIKMGDVARLPQLHGRGDRPEGVRSRSASYLDDAQHVGDDRRRRQGRRARPATSSRRRWSRRTTRRLPPAVRGDLRPGRDRARLPRRPVQRDAVARSIATSPYALTGAIFARDRGGDPRGADDAAPRRRQLLHQRQADRRGRRPAAVRRRPRARAPTTRPARSSICCAGPAPRTIKETFVPPTDYRYPFMGPA